MSYKQRLPQEALEELRTDTRMRILDVRTQPEYDSHHLVGAELVPLCDLQERYRDLDQHASWLVTCEHGIRSVQACEFLAHLGFRDLRNLSGGMARWLGEGLPLSPRADLEPPP